MSVRIRKRKAAWWIFISYRGRRKAKRIGTPEAAVRVKREIEARLALGDLAIFGPGELPTFKRFAEQWVRLYAEVECKESTVKSYKQILRLYLYPRFGKLRLDTMSRVLVKAHL